MIGTGQGVGTIVDNDPIPSLSINSASVTEGNFGTVNAVFTVTLSHASGKTVGVSYATADVTATAGSDYNAVSGSLSFAPGVTTQTITVLVRGDLLDEANETFTVNLSSSVNATISVAQGTGTIIDDDATPSLAINNVSVTEGNVGTVNAVFTVTLSAASGRVVTVNYATANSSATSPSDYTATSGMLTFALGVTTQTITVPVNGDVLNEGNETFNVNLSNAVNASIADSQGVGTIVDDDPMPSLSDQQRVSHRRQLRHDQCGVHRDPLSRERPDGHGQLRHGERDGDVNLRLHCRVRNADIPCGIDVAADHRAGEGRHRQRSD